MAKVDITKHQFVPTHAALSEKEVEQLLGQYNIVVKQLPKILKKDPAIKHLALESGTIVKITRRSPTAGTSVYYRVVAHA